jgi:hypothetical protein
VKVLRPWPAAAALLLAACAGPTATHSPASDPVCHAHRSWFPQRADEGMWDECTRQFGAAWCQRCLWQ